MEPDSETLPASEAVCWQCRKDYTPSRHRDQQKPTTGKCVRSAEIPLQIDKIPFYVIFPYYVG